MSHQPESMIAPLPTEPVDTSGLENGSDRRSDIDGKMAKVAAVLQETGCDGLLLLDPDNVSWLTAGATSRGILDANELPGIYCNGEARWLLCSNVDTQRMFDEELDGLGFQLKEWPYHWGREQLLADLCQGRRVASDVPFGDCVPAGEHLRASRRQLTTYEQACLQAVGMVVSHAVEATGRTLERNQTERDIAAQVSHRLLHRGVQALSISVAVDGRSRRYRQHGFTSTPLTRSAVITATGRKYGLCVTTSRSMCFGEIDPEFRKEHNAVCKVSATYLASTWPDAVPREILMSGRRVYLLSGYEHEWMQAGQGFVTGRAPVEMPLLPTTETLFQPGWAVTWTAGAGAARGGDTYLLSDKGPKLMTPTEVWPLKKIKVQGAEFIHPDILQR